MKILFITSYDPRTGSTFLDNLTRRLVGNGHKVIIATPEFNCYNNKNALMNCNLNDGRQFLFLKTLFVIGGWVMTPFLSYELRKTLDSDIDIVHMHDFRTWQNLIVYWLIKNNLPFVISPCGTVPYSIGAGIQKKVFDFIVGRRLLGKSMSCVAMNKIEKKQIMEIGILEDKITEIPLGINLIKRPTRQGRFREKYGINKNEQILLFLGRIHYIKGLDILLNSLKIIREHGHRLKLVIAGEDAGIKSILKEQIQQNGLSDCVVFTGFLSGKAKNDALFDCDALVLPSRYDLFPNVILEALAFGKPVITTRSCGLAEFIEKTNTGRVVQLSASNLAFGIIDVMFNPKIKDYVNECGHMLVKEHFDIERIADMYINLYQKVIYLFHKKN